MAGKHWQYGTVAGYAVAGSLARPEPGEALVMATPLGDQLILAYERCERVRNGKRSTLATTVRTVFCERQPTPDGEDYVWVGKGRVVLAS